MTHPKIENRKFKTDQQSNDGGSDDSDFIFIYLFSPPFLNIFHQLCLADGLICMDALNVPGSS